MLHADTAIEEGIYTISVPDTINSAFNEARIELRAAILLPHDPKNNKAQNRKKFDNLVILFKNYNTEAKKAELYHLILEDTQYQHNYLHSYYKKHCYEKSNTIWKLITFSILYPSSLIFAYREIKRALAKANIFYSTADEYQIQMDYADDRAFFFASNSINSDNPVENAAQLVEKLDNDISVEKKLKESGKGEIGPNTTYLNIIRRLKAFSKNNSDHFFITSKTNNDMQKVSNLLKIASNPHLDYDDKINKTREIIETLEENDQLRLAICSYN